MVHCLSLYSSLLGIAFCWIYHCILLVRWGWPLVGNIVRRTYHSLCPIVGLNWMVNRSGAPNSVTSRIQQRRWITTMDLAPLSHWIWWRWCGGVNNKYSYRKTYHRKLKSNIFGDDYENTDEQRPVQIRKRHLMGKNCEKDKAAVMARRQAKCPPHGRIYSPSKVRPWSNWRRREKIRRWEGQSILDIAKGECSFIERGLRRRWIWRGRGMNWCILICVEFGLYWLRLIYIRFVWIVWIVRRCMFLHEFENNS